MNRSGILLVDKTEGMSSAQVVAAVKKRLRVSRCGHAGTLDPMATGLLIILLNSATRLASYAGHGAKRYSGTIRWGITTSSDDITGEVLTRSTDLPAFDRQLEASERFIGEIEQIPPKISAIKVEGRRAYKLARDNVEFELKSRKVTIHSLELHPLDERTSRFVISSSPGTYIRSIARDLGEVLGCGACLGSLRRESSDPFDVSKAVTLENVAEEHIQDWGDLFPGAATLLVSEEEARKLLGGARAELQRMMSGANEQRRLTAESDFVVYRLDKTGGALGLLKRGRVSGEEGSGEEGPWEFAANIG